MASLYFAPDLDVGSTAGDRVRVGGDEARHAVTVARVRVGERISVGDGLGLIVSGPVLSASRDELVVEVAEVRRDAVPVPELWLVQALAKGGRDELAVQAATELGASGIIPWAAARSVSRWDAGKADRGRERWASIAREASKQAIRSRIPRVEPVLTTAGVAGLAGPDTVLLVLDPRAGTALTAVPLPSSGRILAVIGPEGGVSDAELSELAEAGGIAVRLGDEVLRTSTAGPAALAVLAARLGRW